MRKLPVFAALALGSPALAQTTIHTWNETEPAAEAGRAVAIWDDLNSDGHAEWVVGAPRQDSGAVDAGRVTVFSGIDHSVYHTFNGTVAGGQLGRSVANAGDLNDDGVDDLVIGASQEQAVYAYSGATLGLLWSVANPADDEFGFAAAGAGDVDMDGHADVVVGAFKALGNDGRVFVYSGDGGGLLFDYSSPALGLLGYSVSAAGDVNGDGFGDVVAGAPSTDSSDGNEGGAVILGGPSGTVLHTHTPDTSEERGMELGWSVAPVGDLNGDGFDDYALGAPWYGWIHYIDDNYVAVFSGATHAEMWRFEGIPDRWFGHTLANAGDVDRDGFDDLIVGDPLSRTVYVLSPGRGLELGQVASSSSDYYGTAVAAGGDIDGDGIGDLVLGDSLDTHIAPGAGQVILFTFGCPPDAGYTYCTAAANSVGAGAQISYQNSLSISANNTRLVATDCPTSEFGIFYFGTAAIELPFGNGLRCVGGLTSRLLPPTNTGASGIATYLMNLTAFPASQIGSTETWFFQFWYRDPAGGSPGFNLSDGLRATFCP